MEKDSMDELPVDEKTVDRYLRGDLTEVEEQALERGMSSSWRVGNMVSRQATVAGRLEILTPVAHGEAYRQEVARGAVKRLAGDENLQPAWKERLLKWADSLLASLVIFRPLAWNARSVEQTRGSATQVRLVHLTPEDRHVLVSVSQNDHPIEIELQGWPAAPLVVVASCPETSTLRVFDSTSSSGTVQPPVFHTSLPPLEEGQYLVSAEPVGMQRGESPK